jgi:predicted heme/steroid binding protein
MTVRAVTSKELRSHTGEGGRPRFIAFQGAVYDVSDCPHWREELHQGLHFAGQDLTQEIDDAPHGPEVFQRRCVRFVGRLVDETAPDRD